MIENLLTDLIEAIKANTAALQGQSGETAAAPKAARGGRKAAAPAEDAVDEAPAKSNVPNYETQVKPAALALSKEKGRDALVSVLAKFKAEKATDLKPEQYAKFITAAEEASRNEEELV